MPADYSTALICCLPSGSLYLSQMQFLRGYCILQAEPEVPSLNALARGLRAQFLTDMALVGDALLEVTGAYRINYSILGNTLPCLHAHIVPRYADEPEAMRKDLPWYYPQAYKESIPFDPIRDRGLMDAIRAVLENPRAP